MVQRFKTYLRPLRRRWGFTQGELAFLLGFETSKPVSQIEALKQTPNLTAALSCAVIFNTAPVKLFPGLLSDAEQSVLVNGCEDPRIDGARGNGDEIHRRRIDAI